MCLSNLGNFLLNLRRTLPYLKPSKNQQDCTTRQIEQPLLMTAYPCLIQPDQQISIPNPFCRSIALHYQNVNDNEAILQKPKQCKSLDNPTTQPQRKRCCSLENKIYPNLNESVIIVQKVRSTYMYIDDSLTILCTWSNEPF